jgi:uncharacterized protein YxeA
MDIQSSTFKTFIVFFMIILISLLISAAYYYYKHGSFSGLTKNVTRLYATYDKAPKSTNSRVPYLQTIDAHNKNENVTLNA